MPFARSGAPRPASRQRRRSRSVPPAPGRAPGAAQPARTRRAAGTPDHADRRDPAPVDGLGHPGVSGVPKTRQPIGRRPTSMSGPGSYGRPAMPTEPSAMTGPGSGRSPRRRRCRRRTSTHRTTATGTCSARDLAFVRDPVRGTDGETGRPSLDPIVFFRLLLVPIFEGAALRVAVGAGGGRSAEPALVRRLRPGRAALGPPRHHSRPRPSRPALLPRRSRRPVDVAYGAQSTHVTSRPPPASLVSTTWATPRCPSHLGVYEPPAAAPVAPTVV